LLVPGVGADIGRGVRAFTRDLVRGVFPRSTTEPPHEDKGEMER
jgi:hypothetical protein